MGLDGTYGRYGVSSVTQKLRRRSINQEVRGSTVPLELHYRLLRLVSTRMKKYLTTSVQLQPNIYSDHTWF